MSHCSCKVGGNDGCCQVMVGGLTHLLGWHHLDGIKDEHETIIETLLLTLL